MRTVSPVRGAAADAGVWQQQAEFLAAIARIPTTLSSTVESEA